MAVVVLSDIHGRYVDRQAWRSVLTFLSEFKPGAVILNGDTADFYEVGSYRKNPGRVTALTEECRYVRRWIVDQLRSAVGASCTLLATEGNHEHRLYRFCADHAAAIWGITPTVPQLLGYTSWTDPEGEYHTGNNVSYHPTHYWINKHLVVTHGVRTNRWCVVQNMNEWKCSGITGHSHRMKSYFEAGNGNRRWGWWENGYLADAKRLPGARHRVDWQHGFSVVYTYDRARFTVDQPQVIQGSVLYAGKEYRG